MLKKIKETTITMKEQWRKQACFYFFLIIFNMGFFFCLFPNKPCMYLDLSQ